MAIDLEILKSERDKLKDGLREVEGELRKLEAQLKVLRQREIQTKREIEAVSTLIDIKDSREPKAESKADLILRAARGACTSGKLELRSTKLEHARELGGCRRDDRDARFAY